MENKYLHFNENSIYKAMSKEASDIIQKEKLKDRLDNLSDKSKKVHFLFSFYLIGMAFAVIALSEFLSVTMSVILSLVTLVSTIYFVFYSKKLTDEIKALDMFVYFEGHVLYSNVEKRKRNHYFNRAVSVNIVNLLKSDLSEKDFALLLLKSRDDNRNYHITYHSVIEFFLERRMIELILNEIKEGDFV